jgi:hypothetical protein
MLKIHTIPRLIRFSKCPSGNSHEHQGVSVWMNAPDTDVPPCATKSTSQ